MKGGEEEGGRERERDRGCQSMINCQNELSVAPPTQLGQRRERERERERGGGEKEREREETLAQIGRAHV